MNKRLPLVLVAMLAYTVCGGPLRAQSEGAYISPITEVGEDLDLSAVLQLFSESENPEAFERALNSEENGVNNVDADKDGQVDYIRVMEYAEEDTHIFVLQVAEDDDSFLDLATIEVEKQDGDDVSLQAKGDNDVYGENYYVELNTAVHVTTFPILGPLFRPGYRVWQSTVVGRRHPAWYRTWRPVTRVAYRTRHRAVRRTVRYATVRRARRAINTQRRRRRRRGDGDTPGFPTTSSKLFWLASSRFEVKNPPTVRIPAFSTVQPSIPCVVCLNRHRDPVFFPY